MDVINEAPAEASRGDGTLHPPDVSNGIPALTQPRHLMIVLKWRKRLDGVWQIQSDSRMARRALSLPLALLRSSRLDQTGSLKLGGASRSAVTATIWPHPAMARDGTGRRRVGPGTTANYLRTSAVLAERGTAKYPGARLMTILPCAATG